MGRMKDIAIAQQACVKKPEAMNEIEALVWFGDRTLVVWFKNGGQRKKKGWSLSRVQEFAARKEIELCVIPQED